MANGLGPKVRWKWKENLGIARAARIARCRQAKKAGDDRLNEDVFSDPVKEDNIWSGINELVMLEAGEAVTRSVAVSSDFMFIFLFFADICTEILGHLCNM